MGTLQKVPLILSNPKPHNPPYIPSFHVIFHFLFHVILHYWGNILISPQLLNPIYIYIYTPRFEAKSDEALTICQAHGYNSKPESRKLCVGFGISGFKEQVSMPPLLLVAVLLVLVLVLVLVLLLVLALVLLAPLLQSHWLEITQMSMGYFWARRANSNPANFLCADVLSLH